MKNTALCILAIAALLPSCSNDLDITADYKETTVVYGLLNLAADTQYISVFKGFLDESRSALEVAQNPDSVYYGDSLIVELEGASHTYTLEKFDAALIGLRRGEGVFVDSPNYVYRFIGALNPDSTYSLKLTNKMTNHVVTAETPIVKDFEIVVPSDLVSVNLATKTLNNVQWREAVNGTVYQAFMRFYYEEWRFASPGSVDTLYVDWNLFSNYTAREFLYRYDGTEFLRHLGNELVADAGIARRALDAPMEFHFFVGAAELYEYIRVSGAQTGITSLQVKPQYTNVANGLGIFSSRYYKTLSGIKITPLSFDSLSCGRYTADLNFVNSTGCE